VVLAGPKWDDTIININKLKLALAQQLSADECQWHRA
jgi:hypothetical protein